MAINRLSESTNEELRLEINNGDYQAFKDTVLRLGFKDEESMIRFMLAALYQSATRSITITDQDGRERGVTPSESLLSNN